MIANEISRLICSRQKEGDVIQGTVPTKKGGAYHCRLVWMRNYEAKQFQVLFLLILTGGFQLHI